MRSLNLKNNSKRKKTYLPSNKSICSEFLDSRKTFACVVKHIWWEPQYFNRKYRFYVGINLTLDVHTIFKKIALSFFWGEGEA